MNPTPVLNISAYKFVTLDDIDALRTRLLTACQERALKGTILLAPEGINVFLAGAPDSIEAFMGLLWQDARFCDLLPKRSWSKAVPFRRMLVKKKREIITMNRPLIRPEEGRAPSVLASDLKRWLDQGRDDDGRPVVLLDTRNAFEVRHGTFEGCVDYGINTFSEFPRAIEAHAHDFADKTVVSFCTGGIRCEKAAILMKEAGIGHVYQLDGGILKYLEQVGSAHWRGNCFVFDDRRALDPALAPAGGPLVASSDL